MTRSGGRSAKALAGLAAVAVVAAMAGGLGGCASVKTTAIGGVDTRRPGGQGLLPYTLPKALLSAELYAIGDGYELDVSRPVLEPDPRYRLFLSARTSILSSDHYEARVDAGSGLLSSVNVEVQDRTGDILQALGQTAGALGNPVGMTRTTARSGVSVPLLARVIFDPLDPASVTAAETELREGIRRWQAHRGREYVDPGRLIEVLPVSGAAAPDLEERFPTTAEVAAACRDVVCAPTYTAIRVRVRAPNGPAVENVTRAPDSRRLARIDFRRSMFVTRETKAGFAGGMATSTTLDKPSEALGAALVPIQVIRASLGAASEIIQLRVNLDNNEQELIRAQAEHAAAAATSTRAVRSEEDGEAASDASQLVTSRSFGAIGPAARVGGNDR